MIGAKIKKNAVPKALYWDTGDHDSENIVAPYHYVRIQRMANDESYDLLIVGGEGAENIGTTVKIIWELPTSLSSFRLNTSTNASRPIPLPMTIYQHNSVYRYKVIK